MDPHKIDPSRMDKLEAPERLDLLAPSEVLDLLDPEPGDRCLDVGAGTGYLSRPLAERVHDGRVVGLDRSHAMLDELAHRARDAGVLVHPVQGLATELPLADAAFACALSVNLHHEVDDRVAMLAEVRRVLEPGGRFLVVDWAPVESPSGPPLAYRVPAGTIADELAAAGFDTVQVHEAFAYHSAVSAVRPGS